MTGRREVARRQTWRELKAAALDDVREHGAVELSLRRVARRIGMSPAGLYRYVDSREDLLTALIAGAYDDLADHLLAATGTSPEWGDRTAPDPPHVVGADAGAADRLRAVALAYRHWGVTHPHEFGLVFGDPIPGYAAPPGGVTVTAMRRVGVALAGPLVDAWRDGVLELPAVELPDGMTAALGPMTEVIGDAAPPELSALLLVTWGRLHGQVSLEVFGHHDWLFPSGCEDLFQFDVESLLRDVGLARR